MHAFAAWLEAHYRYEDDYRVTCRRCGAHVTWVTRHAAERHGDDVEVAPVINSRIEVTW